MKKVNLKEFLLGLNFFDNKFLCKEEEKFSKNIIVNSSYDALLYLEVICEDYCQKNKINDNDYLSYLKETIKRAYISEFLNINKYNKNILDNIDSYSNNELESIIIAADAYNSFKNMGILILPDSFEFKDDKIIDAINLRLSK